MNKTQKASQIEQFREHVVSRELEAREAKALWEKHHYTIEASKLREEYRATMQKEFELQMEMLEQQKQLMADAKANAENLKEDALPTEG